MTILEKNTSTNSRGNFHPHAFNITHFVVFLAFEIPAQKLRKRKEMRFFV